MFVLAVAASDLARDTIVQSAPVNSTTGNSANPLNLTICSGHPHSINSMCYKEP